MHLCVEVAGEIDKLVNCNSSSNEHKDHRPVRAFKDSSDYNKFLEWFKEDNLFECNEKLVSLDTGLVDDQAILNCDKAEEVGRRIN